MRPVHDLVLTAPWYRWRDQRIGTFPAFGPGPRLSRPVFQKFDEADFVNGFIADPQRSLRFLPEDRWMGTEPSAYTGKIRRAMDVRPFPTFVRKIFLPPHRRSYLVVTEVHCDAPGLPDARLCRVAEMGFVIRRVRVSPDRTAAYWSEVRAARTALARARTRLVRLAAGKTEHLLPDPGGPPPSELDDLATDGGPELESAVRRGWESFQARRRRLEALLELTASDFSGDLVEEAWIESSRSREWGAWVPVAELSRDRAGALATAAPTAEGIDGSEKVHALYPLVPDPTAPDHSAEGATLLFGAVPTSGGERDPAGRYRFAAMGGGSEVWSENVGGPADAPDADAERSVTRAEAARTAESSTIPHVQQVLCFVRPRRDRKDKCPGPRVWSLPTEPYRVAEHFDLAGTKNWSVTIETPDLTALPAQAAALPRPSIRQDGRRGKLSFTAEGFDVTALPPGAAICFKNIPLVTIVATFLYEIVKPIVVFIFRLYYLLPLEMCFPCAIGGLLTEIDEALADPSVEDPDEPGGPFEIALKGILKRLPGALGSPFTGLDLDQFADELLDEFKPSELVALVRQLGSFEPEAAVTDDFPAPQRFEARVRGRPRVDAPELVGLEGMV